jgi:hypothetical protein
MQHSLLENLNNAMAQYSEIFVFTGSINSLKNVIQRVDFSLNVIKLFLSIKNCSNI